MRSTFLYIAAIASLVAASCGQKDSEKSEPKTFISEAPYDLVNTFIGTGGHGHTFPGATVPFGMVQLSPDTRLTGWDGCSGYHYSDDLIYGFSHTHLSGTGVSDYGDILLMPFVSEVKLSPTQARDYEIYPDLFDKQDEQAAPGFYRVKLKNQQTEAALTATTRVGIHKYNFTAAKDKNIMLNLAHRDKVIDSKIEVLDDRTIEGYRFSEAWATNQKVFFRIEFSEPVAAQILDDNSSDLFLQINVPDEVQELVAKVSLSATGIEGARANMLAEATDFDFDKYRAKAKARWEKALGTFKIQTDEKVAAVNFYSAFYHNMIAPNTFSDADGKYRGMDDQVHEDTEHDTYTIFSLWDTFRATHPLYTLVQRERTEDFIHTFLKHAKQGEKLPVWELAANETECMIGYHSVSVIADAYAKGITNFDTKAALDAMVAAANRNDFGLQYYNQKDFISASDEPESVSRTLEYAYDDWCIATFAEAIGEEDVAAEFYSRAANYKNVFDPETKFLRARMNGDWFKPFDPAEVNFNYTEANAWQYSLFVPQDISGLISLMGGTDAFETHLDNLFTTESETTGREQADITGLIGQYAHGNEPSHHMAYLYNYIGKPWKTQERIDQILREQYQNAPDGLSGNEDCGQMSAWYVLSAMGFYPVCPGSDVYTFGSPMFDRLAMDLENGKRFEIICENQNASHKYIQRVWLNDEPYRKNFISQNTILAGGALKFEMGDKPNEKWGVGQGVVPSSSLERSGFVAAPYISTAGMTFTDSMQVSFASVDASSDIQFRSNGGAYKSFSEPFWIYEDAEFEFYGKLGENESSKQKVQLKKILTGRSLEIKSEYANQYAAAGPNTLIDQLRGNTNYRTGFWQGYQDQDLEAIVDLGKKQQFNKLGAGFLQDIRSWIWFPKSVSFSISDDGKTWKAAGNAKPKTANNIEGSFIEDLVVSGNWNGRYVKVIAEYPGDCPEWHLGAGGKSWIFADEIIIE